MTDQQIKVEAFDMATDIAKTMGYDGVASALRDLYTRKHAEAVASRAKGPVQGEVVFVGFVSAEIVREAEYGYLDGPMSVRQHRERGDVSVEVRRA